MSCAERGAAALTSPPRSQTVHRVRAPRPCTYTHCARASPHACVRACACACARARTDVPKNSFTQPCSPQHAQCWHFLLCSAPRSLSDSHPETRLDPVRSHRLAGGGPPGGAERLRQHRAQPRPAPGPSALASAPNASSRAGPQLSASPHPRAPRRPPLSFLSHAVVTGAGLTPSSAQRAQRWPCMWPVLSPASEAQRGTGSSSQPGAAVCSQPPSASERWGSG